MNELKQLQDIQDEMREGYAPEKKALDYGEPWRQYGPKETTWLALREDAGIPGDIVCEPPSGWTDSIKHWPDRASRIVACVNACAGMADPSDEIARLRLMQWIPLTVALPSEEDGDDCEDVDWCVGNDIWIGNYKDSSLGNRKATHWRRIVLP